MRITKRICWTNKHGNVSVTDPGWTRIVQLPDGTERDETEAEAIARVVARALPPGTVFILVENDDLTALDPGDRFFNAWRIKGGKVEVDLDAAKALLEGEIGVRRQASPAKGARVRAAMQTARSVAELHALVHSEGWHQARPAYKPPQAATSEEDG